jgi:hypothetical protein
VTAAELDGAPGQRLPVGRREQVAEQDLGVAAEVRGMGPAQPGTSGYRVQRPIVGAVPTRHSTPTGKPARA